MKQKHLVVLGLIFIVGIALITIFQSSKDTTQKTVSHSIKNIKKYSGLKLSLMVSQSFRVAGRYLAETYRNKTGAIVEITIVPYEELEQRIIANHNSNSSQIDVTMFWYVYLGRLAKAGILLDLTDFIDTNRVEIGPDDFIPVIYEAYSSYDGKRWGLPFDGDTHTLFYNKSILKRYGLLPPQSWEEYLNISKLITEKGKNIGVYGSAIMAQPTPIILLSAFMNRLSSYGGKLLDVDNKSLLSSPEALRALKDLMEQSKYALPTPMETSFQISLDAFLTGQVAMVEQWTDLGVMAEDDSRSLIQGQWGVLPLPMGEQQSSPILSLNAGYSLGIPAKSNNKELAKEFLLYATSPATSKQLSLIVGSSGVDPVRFSTINSGEYAQIAPEVSQLQKKYLHHAKAWPTIPQMPEMMFILTKYIHLSLEGILTPEIALEKTNQEWGLLLAED